MTICQKSPEVEALTRSLRRFIETELHPVEHTIETMQGPPDEFIRPLRDKARALGFYAMNMPAEVGGGGLGTAEMCFAEEQIGRTSPVLIRQVFGQVYLMLMACKGAQRERYLLPTVRGERNCCIAITEPNAGSDAASITTTAEPRGEGFIINGLKHFISDGDRADYAIVMAVTDKAKRVKGGITAFLVDKNTPGFTVGAAQNMMGQRGVRHVELHFTDCYVGPEQVLGEVGQGFPMMLASVSRVRLAQIGARAVGMAGRLLDLCAAYATERTQFGKKIGDFQMIQQMLADTATEMFAARTMVMATAANVDAGIDCREQVSMVKLFASEMVNRAADRAVQIFGGMGVCQEAPVERFFRDARVFRIYDGTSEIHRARIATVLMRDGQGPLGLE
ncbi:MAG: acyl-CoA dehydrogenase [Betaproteobacteria bacterium]|nr:acyl-CoA dehydrogenase [Betaproteobacteria bacterium]